MQRFAHSTIAFVILLLALPALAQVAKDKDKDKESAGPFKGLKYRLVGPAAGGRVARSCGVPGDPMTYYIASAAGGVWKSTDGGITWKSIFDDQPTSSIGSITVAPSDANVIYVGSGEANIRGNVMPGNGIYKSTNAGKDWTHVWTQTGQIGKMLVHPTNPDIAYAAVLGNAFAANPERGIYRTSNGGKTWKQVLKKDADTGAIDVCFDPANPRILFAALWQTRRRPWNYTSGGPGSGLYRSEDGGDTWKLLGPKPADAPKAAGKDEKKADENQDNGLPEGIWGRIGIAVAPSDSRRVYALIEAEKGGLYRSDDGGEKWELVNAHRYLRQRPWYFSTVHVDPKNPDVVWCPNVRLLKSIDAGQTFKTHKGPHHPDHHDLWIDPTDARRMIDSNDGGVDLTSNGGETWQAPALPIAQFYHIHVDNSLPYRIMGTMQDQGTASGPSNSLSSAGITLCDWHTVGGGETGNAVPDPSDPNIVFAGEYGGIISRYDHRTRQVRNVSIYPFDPSGRGGEELKYRFQWTAPIMISPHEPHVLYHAANVLFASTDQGATWKAVSPDLTRNDKQKQKWSGGPITGDNTGVEIYGTIFAMAESPKKPGVLWTGSDDSLVHVSQDAGKNWSNVTANIPGLPEWGTVVCIEASPHDAAAAYLVVDAHRLDDNKPYIWKTSDYGKTWVGLAGKLPPTSFARVIRADPATPGLVFVGTETELFYSRDDGQTWATLKLNLPTAAIADLAIKNNDLVVGTSGRSIWILDDLTPIRQWSAKPRVEVPPNPPIAEPQGPRLFASPRVIRWRYHGENYAPEDRIPGENPAKGVLITYHLDQKPKGDLKLDIYDAKGTLLQTLSSKKAEPESPEDAPDVPWIIFKPTVLPAEPGFNRSNWDLTQSGPKVIPGAKSDVGVPHRGPLVVPGSYTIKLFVDGTTLTSTVEVLADPRAKVSQEDLIARHAHAMELRGAISRVSGIVIELRQVRKQLDERVKLWADLSEAKDSITQARKLVDKLDALENQLHNPKAEVTYDILAMKGGAKLYSLLAFLYLTADESDGPVTQGMREVYAGLAMDLTSLEREWSACRDNLTRLNQAVAEAGIANVVVPREKE
jgi:photosystem II stability/assembly factor-like uncharacterized protein